MEGFGAGSETRRYPVGSKETMSMLSELLNVLEAEQPGCDSAGVSCKFLCFISKDVLEPIRNSVSLDGRGIKV